MRLYAIRVWRSPAVALLSRQEPGGKTWPIIGPTGTRQLQRSWQRARVEEDAMQRRQQNQAAQQCSKAAGALTLPWKSAGRRSTWCSPGRCCGSKRRHDQAMNQSTSHQVLIGAAATGGVRDTCDPATGCEDVVGTSAAGRCMKQDSGPAAQHAPSHRHACKHPCTACTAPMHGLHSTQHSPSAYSRQHAPMPAGGHATQENPPFRTHLHSTQHSPSVSVALDAASSVAPM